MKIQHDLHIHTNLSACGQPEATVERYVAEAKKIGLKLIGFANHLWDDKIPGASRWYAPQNMQHILQIKNHIPKDEKDVRILVGCETEFTHQGIMAISEESIAQLDYVLVPHSHTHSSCVVPREQIDSVEKHAAYLMSSFENLIEHSLIKYVTGVVHPFVPGVSHELTNVIQKLIPDRYFYDVFSAAKEKNLPIEINGSTIICMSEEERRNCEYLRIYSIARECGCQFFYGSDNHDLIDRKLPIMESFFDQCGITSDLLTPICTLE